MNENGYVNISVDEYNRLANNATKYRVLLNGLLRNSELAYNGKDLDFDHCPISALLRAIDGHLYSARVFELKSEIKRREAELDD